MAIAYQLRNEFTAADNTALTAYAPDTGPAWSAVTGTFKVSGNKLVPNSFANGDSSVQESGQRDHTVFADVVTIHDGSASNMATAGLLLRYTDSTHHVLVEIENAAVIIYENVGAGYVVLATVALAVTSGAAARLTAATFFDGVSAHYIRVWVDNVIVHDNVAITNTGTKIGVLVIRTGTPAGSSSWDTLTVMKGIVKWGTFGTGRKFTFIFPFDLANATPAKTVMWWHGGGGTDDMIVGNSLLQETTCAIVGAGYRYLASEAHGNNWGNQQGQDDGYELFTALTGSGMTSSGLYFLAGSMGGLASQNAVADARWAGTGGPIQKAYEIDAVCSLADVFGGNASVFAPGIRTAYGIASDGSDYSTKTAGYDPLLASNTVWNGKAWRGNASYGDTVISRANNCDAMSSHIAGHATENTIVTHTGDHSDPSAFQPQDVLNFFAGLTAGAKPLLYYHQMMAAA